MKSPKLLLLGVFALISTETSNARKSDNLMSTLRSEISERKLAFFADFDINICMSHCTRNYQDALAYKCAVSNTVITHEAGSPLLIFQCTIFLIYLIPFFVTPSNAEHSAAEEAR